MDEQKNLYSAVNERLRSQCICPRDHDGRRIRDAFCPFNHDGFDIDEETGAMLWRHRPSERTRQ